MKILLGWLLGVGTALAALAIWQGRGIPDVDPDSVPDASVCPWCGGENWHHTVECYQHDELDDIVYRGIRPKPNADWTRIGRRT